MRDEKMSLTDNCCFLMSFVKVNGTELRYNKILNELVPLLNFGSKVSSIQRLARIPIKERVGKRSRNSNKCVRNTMDNLFRLFHIYKNCPLDLDLPCVDLKTPIS